jgi:glyoxylase-like metal-dependent hydrolase (beta-lactamase superfamily II)/rhodanese-related sulfurtransferase
MNIEQIYTGCLAQGAYYIESDGEAVVIDPLREIQPYLDKAAKNDAIIKYIFETHFHADFVSGHLDLAKQTGATIVFGPTAKPAFDAHLARDGEEIKLGKISFQILHTPGHTLESTSYLLKNEEGKEVAVFTGDTLFIGDVGRPDLAQKIKEELTPEILAGMLYDSLRNKIMKLPEDIIVYPAHGAGSACGKMMSNETADTLGHQKKTNYALRADMNKEGFIKELLTGLTAPPQYFPKNVMLNIQGYDSIRDVIKRGTEPLDVEAFEAAANETGAVLLDTRNAQEFAKAFIPNSINIGINGNFAPWVGTLIRDIKHPILIITDENREEEIVTRLARVGYDHAIGYLKGGFAAWVDSGKETDHIQSIAVNELAAIAENNPVTIIDVRRKSEYDSEHMQAAINAPLDYINESMSKIDKNRTGYVYCTGGYRSMIFASILRARGYNKIVDVAGGFKALKESGKFKMSQHVKKTTEL